MTRLMSCVNQARCGGDVTLHAWALLAFLSRDKEVRYQIRLLQVIFNVSNQPLM
jgi:hypothetical protein